MRLFLIFGLAIAAAATPALGQTTEAASPEQQTQPVLPRESAGDLPEPDKPGTKQGFTRRQIGRDVNPDAARNTARPLPVPTARGNTSQPVPTDVLAPMPLEARAPSTRPEIALPSSLQGAPAPVGDPVPNPGETQTPGEMNTPAEEAPPPKR